MWTRSTRQDLLGGRWPELHGFSWWSETHGLVMSVPEAPELRTIFHDVLNGPLGPNLQDRPIFR